MLCDFILLEATDAYVFSLAYVALCCDVDVISKEDITNSLSPLPQPFSLLLLTSY